MPEKGAPAPPEVSVVAVSWDTADSLPVALDSLGAGFGGRSFETIVVDNGSVDGSVELLRARGDVSVVAFADNRGFTRAANEGVRQARGRFVLFLNPDVVAPPGSLAALVDALDDRPGCWGATPAFRNPDGSVQHFWIRFPGAPSLLLAFTRWGRKVDNLLGGRCRRRRNYLDAPAGRARVIIHAAGAACLLVRRDEFLEAGAFDEGFLNFFQDGEFARRMWRRGRTLLGVSDVTVEHGRGVTVNRLSAAERDGQFLAAFGHYLDGEPFLRRMLGRASVALDTLLPRADRADLRTAARRA